MLNRILEIAEENRFISLRRGFIVIEEKQKEIASVPLDDIVVLIVSAQSTIITKNILNALAEKGCITVFCGKNYIPSSMVTPVSSNVFFTKILKQQISASEPLKKRIWQKIVIQKIKNQSLALKYCNKEGFELLNKISMIVKSGDPDNREAYAARMYWKNLFGQNFIRDYDGDGINAFLNYGYAIMRAAMVRAICSHGLLPALGIHHDNNLNQFCLADDLFEIYRPIVDCLVFKLLSDRQEDLTPENKQIVASCLKIQMKFLDEMTTSAQSMHYLISSYIDSLNEGKNNIQMPLWEINKDGITIVK